MSALNGACAALLILQARDLRSEEGENPEYDRALVELVARCLGVSDDDKDHVYALVGVVRVPAHQMVQSIQDDQDKRATCTCGWTSGTQRRRVEAVVAWQYHAGLRHDGPGTVVTQ